jgi:transposase
MRQAIEKKFDIVLVDEFRTSKLCSCCHGELENYKIKNKKLHRLLICRSCKSNGLENKNITFMNRDMNACINIRKISSDWINHKSRNNNFCRNICIDSNKGVKHILKRKD